MEVERKEKLEELVKNIRTVFNVTVAIYDAERNCIVGSNSINNFCEEVRKNGILEKRCRECDLLGFNQCAALKTTYSYQCHMGLFEISTPIIFGETILGYIIIGQFTNHDTKNLKLCIEKIANELNFSPENLYSLINSVPKFSNDYVIALKQMLEMCAGYVWLKDIFETNHSNLALEIRIYINNRLSENITVNSVCRNFGISSATLYRILQKEFGCGLKSYILKERMEKAKELLAKSKNNISEIGEKCGIQDANYFSRIFKNETGLTPKEYRATVK